MYSNASKMGQIFKMGFSVKHFFVLKYGALLSQPSRARPWHRSRGPEQLEVVVVEHEVPPDAGRLAMLHKGASPPHASAAHKAGQPLKRESTQGS